MSVLCLATGDDEVSLVNTGEYIDPAGPIPFYCSALALNANAFDEHTAFVASLGGGGGGGEIDPESFAEAFGAGLGLILLVYLVAWGYGVVIGWFR